MQKWFCDGLELTIETGVHQIRINGDLVVKEHKPLLRIDGPVAIAGVPRARQLGKQRTRESPQPCARGARTVERFEGFQCLLDMRHGANSSPEVEYRFV